MSIKIILILSSYQSFLIIIWWPKFAQTWNVPQRTWLHISLQSDNIQHNGERDCRQAQPDNVVGVEVPCINKWVYQWKEQLRFSWKRHFVIFLWISPFIRQNEIDHKWLLLLQYTKWTVITIMSSWKQIKTGLKTKWFVFDFSKNEKESF